MGRGAARAGAAVGAADASRMDTASRMGAAGFAGAGLGAVAFGPPFSSAGFSGALSAPSSPASSWPILATCRDCGSPGWNWVPMKAWAISMAVLGSSPAAARQSTLASTSSRLRRAESASWHIAARMPRILLAAITPPVPLAQRSRLASTKPRSTAWPTARA